MGRFGIQGGGGNFFYFPTECGEKIGHKEGIAGTQSAPGSCFISPELSGCVCPSSRPLSRVFVCMRLYTIRVSAPAPSLGHAKK